MVSLTDETLPAVGLGDRVWCGLTVSRRGELNGALGELADILEEPLLERFSAGLLVAGERLSSLVVSSGLSLVFDGPSDVYWLTNTEREATVDLIISIVLYSGDAVVAGDSLMGVGVVSLPVISSGVEMESTAVVSSPKGDVDRLAAAPSS